MLRAGREGGHRARPRGQDVHGRRRARPRRRDHRRDPRGASSGPRPPTASSSTASRARSRQAEALEDALEELGRCAHRRPAHRGPRRRDRAAAVGPPRLEERPRLPRRVRPAEARGRVRRRRLRAHPARRRQARDHPQAPRGLPRADRAAGRLLRGARPAAPLRRQPPRRRRSTTTSGRRSRRCARLRGDSASDDHPQESPAEIEKMAAAGDDPRRGRCGCSRARSARASPPPSSTQAAERFIRSQGATPAFKGYRGFPGSICASPNSMVVHGIPGPYQLQARRHHLGRRRRHQGRLGRRRRAHVPGRRRSSPVARKLLAVTQRVAVRRRRRSAGPATAWATSPTRSRRASRPRACRSSARSSATGSAARCTRTRRSRTSASPAAARCWRRAWCWRSSRWSPPARHQVRMGDDGWAIYSQDGSLAAHFEFTVAVTADGSARPHALARAGRAGARGRARPARSAGAGRTRGELVLAIVMSALAAAAVGPTPGACPRLVAAAAAAARATPPDPARKGP